MAADDRAAAVVLPQSHQLREEPGREEAGVSPDAAVAQGRDLLRVGGLGQLAYTDGFQSYNNAITLAATVTIVIIVMVFQFLGDRVVKRIDKR